MPNLRNNVHFKLGEVSGFLYRVEHSFVLSPDVCDEAKRLRAELLAVSNHLTETVGTITMPDSEEEEPCLK